MTTNPERLTALVFLGIRDRDTFPLVFYRDRCADMAGDALPLKVDQIVCGGLA